MTVSVSTPPEAARAAAEPDTGGRCWALCRDLAGLRSQAEGLARAVGLPSSTKMSALRRPWRFLPLWAVPSSARVSTHATALADSAEPSLVISCGRHAVPPALHLKRRLGRRVLSVHIQAPTISTDKFDLVVSPRHDVVRGPNVLESLGALHRITPTDIRDADQPDDRLDIGDGRPIVTVLLGGPNRYYGFTEADADNLVSGLRTTVRDHDTTLLIVPSRRTPTTTVTRMISEFGHDHFVWTGEGENPYLRVLARATSVVVTGDSVSMVSEAAVTGKPVFVFPLTERRRAVRFRRFHEQFRTAGITRPFNGRLAEWDYPPLVETQRIASVIRNRLGA